MKHLCLALLILMPQVARGDELPLLKEGRWRTVVSPSANNLLPKTEVTFCTDHKTQPKFVNFALQKSSCSGLKVNKQGLSYLARAECNFLGRKVEAVAKISVVNEEYLSGDSALRDGAFNISALHESRFLGPCAPGEKPGAYKYTSEESGLPALQELLKGVDFNS